MTRRRTWAAAVVGVAFSALAGGPACGATFYCDPKNGSPQGDGSAARPWRTLEEVVQARRIRLVDAAGACRNPDAPVKAGDSVLLLSGWHGALRIAAGYNAVPVTIAAAHSTPTASSARPRTPGVTSPAA